MRIKESADIRVVIPASSISASFKKEKNVLQLLHPAISYSRLSKLSSDQEKKIQRRLLSLDEMSHVKKYKFGVLYCKEGQFNENDMFGNGLLLSQI